MLSYLLVQKKNKYGSFFSLCMTQITEAVPNGAILF